MYSNLTTRNKAFQFFLSSSEDKDENPSQPKFPYILKLNTANNENTYNPSKIVRVTDRFFKLLENCAEK